MEHQCIVTAIAYQLHIAPFSLAQLKKLERACAVLKSIFRLPNHVPKDMLFASATRLGCQVPLVDPTLCSNCAGALASSFNGLGRLGILVRASIAV